MSVPTTPTPVLPYAVDYMHSLRRVAHGLYDDALAHASNARTLRDKLSQEVASEEPAWPDRPSGSGTAEHVPDALKHLGGAVKTAKETSQYAVNMSNEVLGEVFSTLDALNNRLRAMQIEANALSDTLQTLFGPSAAFVMELGPYIEQHNFASSFEALDVVQRFLISVHSTMSVMMLPPPPTSAGGEVVVGKGLSQGGDRER